MKKYILALLVVSTVVLSGCINTDTTPASSEPGSVPAAEDKSGDTMKTGTLVNQGQRYYIKAAGGEMEEVESYSIDFNEYVNQSVTVVGQYSGDTLFVGQINFSVE